MPRAALVLALLLVAPLAAAADPTPPTPPGGLRAAAATSASITLAWDASADPESGVARYEVYRAFVLVGSTPATSFRDAGLAPDAAYDYLVFAVNGEGAYSDPAALAARTRPAPGPDCGQVAHALAADPDGDSARGDDRSDLVRASLRETPGALEFRLGVYDLDAPGGPAGFEVAFLAQGVRWVLAGSFGDAGPGAGSLSVQAAEGGPLVALPADVSVSRACDSLVLGVRKEDAGDPQPGDVLRQMTLRATAAGATLDAAPDAGTTGYVLGSAGQPPVLDAVGDRAAPEGALLAFDLHALDPDGDPVSYEADGLPAGAALDGATGAFSWRPGYAQAGAHPVTFRATDGRLASEEPVTLLVQDVDTTPVLEPVGDREVPEGATLAFTLQAADEDGDALAYEAANLPEGATLDPATGAFSWTPGFAPGHDDRAHAVTFAVRDRAHAVSERVLLTVRDVNRPPVLDPVGPVDAREGEETVVALSAADPDGDAPAFSATGLPPGAAFDPAAATLRWTPGFGDQGEHAVTFAATDGALSDQETATLRVANVNRPPVLDPVGPRAVAEGDLLEVALSAADPDGDALSYAAFDLPPGAAFDPATATFRWRPAFDQGGAAWRPRFEATDGEATVGETVPVSVLDVDRPPVLDPVADVLLGEGEARDVPLRALDPDGGPVAITLEGSLPPGATFEDQGEGRALLRLAPPSGAAGSYPLLVRAASGGLDSTTAFTVTVRHRAFPALEREGPAQRAASPGETLLLTATLRNLAAVPETFRLDALTAPGWTLDHPAEVILAPGAAATLVVRVAVPEGFGGAGVLLRAVPLADPARAAELAWTVDVPLALRLHVDATGLPAWGRPTGVLSLRHLDGTPARNVQVGIVQTPRGPASGFASRLSGATDANGLWFFDFDHDLGARLPGEHEILARAEALPGGAAVEARGTYRVG